MSLADELFEAVAGFEKIAEFGKSQEFKKPIEARSSVIDAAAKAHSGSWIGYQSCVYQQNLNAIPGAYFDSRWGLRDELISESRGDWVEYDRDELKQHLVRRSGYEDISNLKKEVGALIDSYNDLQASVFSMLETYLEEHPDSYIGKLKEQMDGHGPVSAQDIIKYYMPQQVASADRQALSGGIVPPPHVELAAEIQALTGVFITAPKTAKLVRQAASHIERKVKNAKTESRIGTNVFIGHGRSPLWRELKDFIVERMHLPADEFNRVPVAGIMNVARLSQMLDAAAVALLIMTAEDETSEGVMHARMNVIHEVGLFQGRLGFSKAIIMLEEGCEEFSNVHGLGQIRFPKGNIAASFEQVREVLEREGLAE